MSYISAFEKAYDRIVWFCVSSILVFCLISIGAYTDCLNTDASNYWFYYSATTATLVFLLRKFRLAEKIVQAFGVSERHSEYHTEQWIKTLVFVIAVSCLAVAAWLVAIFPAPPFSGTYAAISAVSVLIPFWQ